jgi:hypothetical protein
MKKILSVITLGVVYVLFVFSFSFFDSINFIEKMLVKFGLKGDITETIGDHASPCSDPLPDPPIPPPPPPGGGGN